jgi:hypothetical protein
MFGTERSVICWLPSVPQRKPRIRHWADICPPGFAPKKELEAAVLSSQYLRAQAQLYVDIARLLTDPRAAENAMATAAKYLAQAEEMERAERISSERAVVLNRTS